MGRGNQPRDRRGRWTTTGRGASLSSQRNDFARALQHGPGGDNSGRSTVYAYLRDKDSPSGKAGSPYYVGVAGYARRPFEDHRKRENRRAGAPTPNDERRIRMLRSDVTHRQAREWEKYYISRYGRKGIDAGGMLLNRSTGGESGAIGTRHTRVSRANMSAAAKRRGVSQAALDAAHAAHQGTKASAETKAKMSAAQLRRNEHKAAAYGIDSSQWQQLTKTQKQRLRYQVKQGLSPEDATKIVMASGVGQSRAFKAAQKYGLSVESYSGLTPHAKKMIYKRYEAGKRGADLLLGL